jgi:hypothetical protein
MATWQIEDLTLDEADELTSLGKDVVLLDSPVVGERDGHEAYLHAVRDE